MMAADGYPVARDLRSSRDEFASAYQAERLACQLGVDRAWRAVR